MTDKVQKIRKEVEKRYEYWKEKESNSHSIESEIRMSECQHLLLMLDSLQEEPKECIYSKDNYTDKDRKVLCDSCEEKCELNKKEEPISEELEKAALQYSGSHAPYDDCMQEVKDAYIDGYKKFKQQLMAKAVGIEVKVDAGGYPYIDATIGLYDYVKEEPLAKVGDKVKVIVIKDE